MEKHSTILKKHLLNSPGLLVMEPGNNKYSESVTGDSSRHLSSVLKKNLPYSDSPRLLVMEPENINMSSQVDQYSDSVAPSPRKMHVHFSNTLEVVHDIHVSSSEHSSDRSSGISEYSSDFEVTDSTAAYSSDFETATSSTVASDKYSSDFETPEASGTADTSEQTFSGDIESFSSVLSFEQTSQLDSDDSLSDTRRNVSDGSYTDSQYSDISSLADDNIENDYSYTFESTSQTSKTNLEQTSSYNYDEDTFEGITDSSSIKHSILDSLVFPDLSDIETSDVVFARNQFMTDLIYKLKHPNIRLDMNLPEVNTGQATKQAEKRSSKHLSKYCEMKIKQLNSKTPVSKKPVIKPKPQPIRVENYGIGSNQVERLKLDNLKARLKLKCEEEIHDVKTCSTCSNKLKEVEGHEARKEFIRKTCQKVESDIMDDKIQNHLIKMNSVNLIADIIKSIPKLTDNSSETLYQYKQLVESRIINNT